MAPEEETKFILPQLSSCCCFSIRGGLKVLGWFNVVLGILLIVAFLFFGLLSPERDQFYIDENTPGLMVQRHIRRAGIAESLILPISGFFLLVGVNKRASEWLLTSLILLCACLVLDFYASVLLVVSREKVHDDTFSLVMRWIGIFLGTLFTLTELFGIFVINSYHNILMMEQSFRYKPQNPV